MADIKISEIAVLVTSLTGSDLLMGERVSDGVTVKITKANAIGATFTGGGTIATGGFTLTVPATGTAALLGAQQSFTQQQTIAPTDAGDDGVIANMPSGTTNGVAFRAQFNGTSRAYIQITSALTQWVSAPWDNGTGVGALMLIDRNNNASTPAPGAVLFRQADAGASFVWSDNSEIMRVAATQPTNAGITSGTVIGSQSSHISYKDVVGDPVSDSEALAFVVAAAGQVKRFTYKNGAYNNQEFSGVVLDGETLDRYGVDADAEHAAGKSLNEITSIGDLFKAVRALDTRLAALES